MRGGRAGGGDDGAARLEGLRGDLAAMAVAAGLGDFVAAVHALARKAHAGQPCKARAILQTGGTPVRAAQSQPVQG